MKKRDKLKNIEQANMVLEQSYLKSKGLVVTESVFLSDIDDNEFFSILKETCHELGLKVNLNENKDLLKEGVTVMVIGAALASGKFLDLIGSLFRKAYNLFIERFGLMKKMREKKCKTDSEEEKNKCIEELLKSQSIEKTWLEKAGEWIHKNIIMNIFKLVATVLVSIFASGFLIKKEGGLNTELIEKVANTLFYVSITIFGLLGLKALVAHGIHGLPTLPGVVESVAVGTKGYELVLLIFASILITLRKVKESNPPTVAHKLGECLEGGGKVSSLFKNIKRMAKDSGLRKQIYLCVDLQEHEH